MKLVFMICVKMKHGMNVTLFFSSCSWMMKQIALDVLCQNNALV